MCIVFPSDILVTVPVTVRIMAWESETSMNVMSPKIKNKKRKVLKRSIFKCIAYSIFSVGLIKFGLTGEKKASNISIKALPVYLECILPISRSVVFLLTTPV